MQGLTPSGAVRQDTFGKLPDVPVPKNMSSILGVGCTRSGEWSESGMVLEEYPTMKKKKQFQGRVINLRAWLPKRHPSAGG